jgi:Uma2 family endonuclease
MATATAWRTIRDLVEQLGDIPLDRIRMNPPPGQATEDDVIAFARREKCYCVPVDGVLVEKTVGLQESLSAIALAGFLKAFVIPRNLGVISGADGMIRLSPGLVRGPDLAFASWDRFPDRRIPKEPIPTLAPDLVAEVLSVSDTAKEMKRKRGEDFSQGVPFVRDIDPRERKVTVYHPDATKSVLNENDRLDGGDVPPGFSLELRELVAEPDRHG